MSPPPFHAKDLPVQSSRPHRSQAAELQSGPGVCVWPQSLFSFPLTTAQSGPLRAAGPSCAERRVKRSGVSHNTPCTTDRSEAQRGEVTSQGRRLTLSPPRGAGILTAPLCASGWRAPPPLTGAPHRARCGREAADPLP